MFEVRNVEGKIVFFGRYNSQTMLVNAFGQDPCHTLTTEKKE